MADTPEIVNDEEQKETTTEQKETETPATDGSTTIDYSEATEAVTVEE